MKFHPIILTIAFAASFSHAALFTNSVSVDAFVRSNAPTSNYGGAGALTVSGSTATNASGAVNGVADTFIRFNTGPMATGLNSIFGPNNWVINGATVRVVETGAPANNIFTRGKGAFEIRWISNDSWTEGTGMPMGPIADGIVYTDEPPLLTNTISLGTFTNAAANATDSFPLSLPAAFAGDISGGGEVGLYLTAIDPGIGFTFNSQNFGTATQRPVLVISAVPRPGAVGISLSGADVVIVGTNGAQSGTYVVLSSTNLLSSLDQWTPITTNVLNANGAFNITITNGNVSDSPVEQFFILQTQ